MQLLKAIVLCSLFKTVWKFNLTNIPLKVKLLVVASNVS